MLRNQKGQGLLEFALILPLLLLLILGIVEAARVIWGFINVQQAAREAARFAVTGRPYLDPQDPDLGNPPDDLDTQLYDICLGNPDHDPLLVEPDPVYQSAQPWVCEDLFQEINPDTNLKWIPRVEAIKQIAIEQGLNLAVSRICRDYPADTDPNSPDYNGCQDLPGAFSVLIRGQTTTNTMGTLVVATEPVTDYPGLQGLNVQVNTAYNLQMITPIFDVIMGGQYITLRGSVTLQNEGLDDAAGIEPPPPIPAFNPGDGDTDETPPGTPSIVSLSGHLLSQTDLLKVRLAFHPVDSYLIFLTDGSNTYQICPNPVSVADEGTTLEVDCDLGMLNPLVDLGTYTLYSAKTTDPGTPFEQDPDPVVIEQGAPPEILVADGNTLADNDQTSLTLKDHSTGSPVGPLYDVKLFDPSGILINVITETFDISTFGNTTPWHIQDADPPKCASGGCTVRSFTAGEADPTQWVAKTTVKITQPYITLSKDTGPYARGETVYVWLFSHTPNKQYTVLVDGADQESLPTIATNNNGDTPNNNPIVWNIPSDCGGIAGDWPDATDYVLTSHPGGVTTPESTIATYPDVIIETPSEPFLTVAGGNEWPIGSFINIKLHKHVANTPHYLKFNGVQVGGPGHTFSTDGCGEAIKGYSIPIGLTPGLTYVIESFDPAISNTVPQATTVVLVTSSPIIQVLEGDTVLPNSVITIRLLGHEPDSDYDIFYDNKFLLTVTTNEFGFIEATYDLSNLPATPPPDMTNPANYGTYPLFSQDSTVSPPATVATTDLTIQGADLAVTQVIVPPVGSVSTTIPIDVVVTNLQPVPIEHWFDVDLYFLQIPDPDPIAPSYLSGYNFPGNIKYWKDSVGPNEVFTIPHQLDINELGLHSIYGYADTSNTVFEGEGAGQVANPNNIGNSTHLADCSGAVFTDDFSDASLPNWNSIAFGTGNVISGTSASGNVLSLTSTGTGFNTNDDASRGLLYFYRSDSILSSAGLDVQVKILDIEKIANFSTAGIEIRSSLASDSGKIFWGALRSGGGSNYFVAAGSRSGGSGFDFSPNFGTWQSTTSGLDLAVNPLWLRVERDVLTGDFNFYYKNDGTNPASPTDTAFWGAPAHTMSAGGIGNEVLVGLMNAPMSNAVAGTSQFQQFSLIGCSGQAFAPPTFPPGYEACTVGLLNQSFESGESNWVLDPPPFGPQGVFVDSLAPAYTDSNSLSAATYEGGNHRVPAFYQTFTMPDWVIESTTEFKVDLFKNAYRTNPPLQPPDSFKVVVATSPDPATALTVPAEVANGGDGVVASQLDPAKWSQTSVTLQPTVNLENYVGQQLYLYFYNFSNEAIVSGGGAGGTPCGAPDGCRTNFYFDDIDLNTCTTQPPPPVINTQIQGQLTLIIGDSAQQLPFVKVWAYRESDQTVYETFTIEGGEFNFYNLPVGDYTVFAQYFLVDPEDPTQVEVLQADGAVTLTAGAPATISLTLYALDSLN